MSIVRIPSNDVGLFAAGASVADLARYAQEFGKHVGKYAKNEYGGRRAVGPFGYDLDNGLKRKLAKGSSFPNKMPKYSGSSATNQLANRASMKKYNPVKAKSKRGKKVKVSAKLRKKINAVIAGKKYYGEYTTTRMGTIGVGTLGTGGLTQPTHTLMLMSAQSSAFFPLTTSAVTNSKSYWMVPLYVLNSLGKIDGASGSNYRASDTWAAFFHPMKILDAASVLWNRKPISDNWTNTTLNLSTRANLSGVDLPGSVLPQNLKIDVVNSYVTFELKNNSKREVTIEIYNIYSKRKIVQENALNTLYDCIDTELSNNGSMLSNESTANTMLDISVRPGDVSTFKQNYKYSTITVKIKPGETCKHSIQGPKNITVDYGKFFAPDNADGLQFIPKGTVQVLMAVYPDLQVRQTLNTPAAPPNPAIYNADFATGHMYPIVNSTESQLKLPISVKWQEHFKLRCPDVTGWISRALPGAGSGVPLNLKRSCKAFGDFAQIVESPTDTYYGFDEEVPADQIEEGERY